MTIALHKQVTPDDAAAHVVIVSVDALITATLTAALQSVHCVVTEVVTTAQALAICATQRFQLAIIDEHLPGMTGPQLALALRESYGLPAAFLCSHDNPALITEAIDAKSLGLIGKPLDPACLLPILQVALAKSRELLELRTRATHLTTALCNERSINTAVRVLMERWRVTRQQAFESLRRYARSQRQQVVRIANELLDSSDPSRDLEKAIAQSRIARHNASLRRRLKDSNTL